ncbi:MFS transporter [Acidihalobacter ferrooxydans]|uniref:MFS transporter n=1 Tax=Acidihalobacter ferrooxydans TaxID=1765967 RepID=A0A1P8ULH1_9GAMM|nr:MFS transporter [Acidihalobacter ferrooxydans]
MAQRPGGAPYWRLSGFYFVYFTVTGAFVPYWSLYLRHFGYAPVAIGVLTAVPMATKIVAPFLWGWLADRSGQRMRVIRLGTWFAALSFLGIFFGHDALWLALVVGAFSFFWNAALPQFEAATLGHLGAHDHHYSRIRLWGSIGFVVSVVALGWAFGVVSVTWLAPVIAVLLVALWLSSLAVPGPPVPTWTDAPQHGIGPALRQPAVLALLLTCLLIQTSHGPYYVFFTLYLRDHGYSSAVTGELWALGVLAEIVVFVFMPRLLPRFGARRLLIFALSATVLRWVLIATLVDSLPVLVFSQTLHAASYGIYHAAAIYLIYRYFPGQLQGRGQALYSSVSFGLGGALGALASGYVWSGVSPAATFLMGAALAAGGAVVAYVGVRGISPVQSPVR